MPKLKKLSEIVAVGYGTKLDLNKLEELPARRGGINFVGRSSKANGVTATVAHLPGIVPYDAGLITVALGGSKLLSSFVQERPFYTAQNVAVLRPRTRMTFEEKVLLCLFIQKNRFRYSAFGREANRTLSDLLVPELSEFPKFPERPEVLLSSVAEPVRRRASPGLFDRQWEVFHFRDLFEIRKGTRLTKAKMRSGVTPFIGAVDGNNGVTAHVSSQPRHAAGTITVSYNGSVGEAFFQDEPFWASDDVNVLYPKFPMSKLSAFFLITVIRSERFRFSYGRKWNKERMLESTINLPMTADGRVDFQFMEDFISTLRFSSQLMTGKRGASMNVVGASTMA